MKISLCLAAYQGSKYITKQLTYILGQSLQPDEVIICDDHSTDGTAELAADFIAKHKLAGHWQLYVNEVHKGYPENFYYGMSLCHGDVVFLADQDDIWETDKIFHMYHQMKQRPDISLLISDWGQADDAGCIKRRGRLGAAGKKHLIPVAVSDVLYQYVWPGMAMCYRARLGRQVLSEAGSRPPAHDMALALKAAAEGGFYILPRVLQYHRKHTESASLGAHLRAGRFSRNQKLSEIEQYIAQLQKITESQLCGRAEMKELLEEKQRLMKERYYNLEHRRILAMIAQYWKHRTKIRPGTLMLDMVLCRQKG